jgi:hypothetical protein
MHASPDAELPTTPFLGAMTGAGLADRLVRAYCGRLAPAFVRRVLRDEQGWAPARADDVVERAVRRRLDAWLTVGRYPLTRVDDGANYPDSSSVRLPGCARGWCSRDA